MRRIPVWRGEFGLKVRFWVPQVYAVCRAEPCEVGVEPGNEALFPAAERHSYAAPLADHNERAAKGRPPRITDRAERFVPDPHVPQGVEGVRLVICPRQMEYGESKNWPYWGRLAALPDTFAAGAPGSSVPVDCPAAWDHARFLDASIEAIRQADLVVATDAGLAHLAVLCGAPLLLITHRGRVAPGPVVNSSGRTVADDYWPVRLDEYYHAANHTGAPIDTVDGWEDPGAVIDAIAERVVVR